MKFDKINYEEEILKDDDKINKTIIYIKNNDSNKSQVKISEKEVKKAVKVLSRQNKQLQKTDNGLER